MKIPPHVNHLRLHSRINLHTKLTAHTIMQTFLTNDHHTHLNYFVSVKSYLLPSLAQDKIYHFIHKSQNKFITSYIIKSGGWQHAETTPLHSWTNPTIWKYWVQDSPFVPGRWLIVTKLSKDNLVDNRPKKRVKITKGRFFLCYRRLNQQLQIQW